MPISSAQKVVKFAPATTGDKRIDVAIHGEITSIKLSSLVDGLGWCGEKTMAIEPEMLDVLHSLIGAARVRLRHQRTMEGHDAAERKVLDFPR